MENHDVTELVMHLAFQLTAILIAAKLAGEVCERWLKIPPVIGELLAGVLIGPFALGQYEITQSFGALFPKPHDYGADGGSVIPVSDQLWSVGQIGAMLLLFLAGLETDAKLFRRYAVPGLAVAAGGVLLPFLFGVLLTVWMGFADSYSDAEALFMGAIMTATSVGITARVLSEKKKLDSPEGVTVLAAAVIDDVLGILVLTVVVGIAATGSISPSEVVKVAAKAVGFWVGLTVIGTLLSDRISRSFLWFKAPGTALALAVALAFFSSALAETFGLAMIIGAYSIGLALSSTRLKHSIEQPLTSITAVMVPIFFVVMGTLVDLGSMKEALTFGIVLTLLAIISKVIGAGFPALFTGFNLRGASRIGIGMLPRGEVALIVAGVGLSRGVIEQDEFGVAIMMTIVTTVIAPILIVPLFTKGGSGLRKGTEEQGVGSR
ncbi:MAG: cation:proton antiporter [Chloroflexi bacterium]|nr:cation:proton antiporter [Chloroflexota bacterium]